MADDPQAIGERLAAFITAQTIVQRIIFGEIIARQFDFDSTEIEELGARLRMLIEGVHGQHKGTNVSHAALLLVEGELDDIVAAALRRAAAQQPPSEH